MKKMIVAVLVVVVLFGLALAQPAVAPKPPPKPPKEPKELGTFTLARDLAAFVEAIKGIKCGKDPSVYLEGIDIAFNDRGSREDFDTGSKPWNFFEAKPPSTGVVSIKTSPGQFKLDDELRFVHHFHTDGRTFPGGQTPTPPWFTLVFIDDRAYDRSACTLTLLNQPTTVEATIRENSEDGRVVVWSGTLDLTLELDG